MVKLGYGVLIVLLLLLLLLVVIMVIMMIMIMGVMEVMILVIIHTMIGHSKQRLKLQVLVIIQRVVD